jgi:hypothetical protein
MSVSHIGVQFELFCALICEEICTVQVKIIRQCDFVNIQLEVLHKSRQEKL